MYGFLYTKRTVFENICCLLFCTRLLMKDLVRRLEELMYTVSRQPHFMHVNLNLHDNVFLESTQLKLLSNNCVNFNAMPAVITRTEYAV